VFDGVEGASSDIDAQSFDWAIGGTWTTGPTNVPVYRADVAVRRMGPGGALLEVVDRGTIIYASSFTFTELATSLTIGQRYGERPCLFV
jgi:hypothetical protein